MGLRPYNGYIIKENLFTYLIKGALLFWSPLFIFVYDVQEIE